MNDMKKSMTQQIIITLIAALVILVAAHLLDRTVYRLIHDVEASGKGFPKMFRGTGYAPFWILVSLALLLIDYPKRITQGLAGFLGRGLTLLAAALLSGGAAEITKLFVRRLRPDEVNWNGVYVFRSFSDHFFRSSNLGIPSSHTAVSFGAAFLLCRMYPRAWPIWLSMGVGCAAQRLLEHAHFFSDVTAAAIIGYFVAWAIWQNRPKGVVLE